MLSYLGNDILELPFSPGISRVTDHGENDIVILLVLIIEKHQLCPEVCLLRGSQHLVGQPRLSVRLVSRVHTEPEPPRGSNYLWDVDTGPEELQVLWHLLWLELGVQDGQFCEHAHVGPL